MPNGPTSSAGDGRPGREPADVGGEQPAEVVADALGLGDDHDAADGGDGHPDADAHHEPADEQRHEVPGRGHQQQPGDVEAHPAEHELAGVATVGERGDEDLGQEPGEEADPDHRAERRLADAVLVADVVEHAEQRAVAHRQQRQHQPERHQERGARSSRHRSGPYTARSADRTARFRTGPGLRSRRVLWFISHVMNQRRPCSVFDDRTPIYRQIAGQLREDIVSGLLDDDEQVMSTNQYAAFHRINPATVAKAFQELVDDGLLYKKRGLGMFVAPGAGERLRADRRARFFDEVLAPVDRRGRRASGIPIDDVVDAVRTLQLRP